MKIIIDGDKRIVSSIFKHAKNSKKCNVEIVKVEKEIIETKEEKTDVDNKNESTQENKEEVKKTAKKKNS